MKQEQFTAYCFIEKKERKFVTDADNPETAVCCTCPMREKIATLQRERLMSK